MKKNYFFTLLLFCQTITFAQNFSWLQIPSSSLNINPSMVSYPSTTDNQGNTFVCGYKDAPFLYNRVQGNLLLSKYNSSGTLLFSKTLTGDLHAHKLQTDNDGNLYLAIDYLTAISIDNFSQTSTLLVENPLLIKFNSNGDYIWHKTIPGEFTNHFAAIVMDSNQNLYIGYDDYNNSYIEKIDKNNGATLQTITQSQVKRISSISVDNEGNIYASGSCAEIEANFNGTDLPAPNLYTIYITKYNSNGQMQWTKYIEDITCPSPKVAARTPNEVYFSSELFDSFPFDSIIPEGPISGYSDFFLAKLNQTGDFLWVKEVPGIGSATPGMNNSLEIDSEGNIYFGGNTGNTVQWNEIISTTANGFSDDILVLKYNPSGTIIWAKTAGGNSYDHLHSISLLPDGNLVITGIANGNTTFEPLNHNPNNSNHYPFVTRLNQTTLDLPENEIKSLVVYPNPAKETITVQSNHQNGVATLHNLLGQLLKTIAITSNETTFDIRELSKGTYFFKLNSEVIKIIKE